jgi:predicted secreted acid phosphatase
MKRLVRPRAPWVVLALGIAALAAAGAVAVAGLQPADLSYTPNSESQVTNVDVARAWIKNYYGSPGATTGKAGDPTGKTQDWRSPLNAASNYAAEASSVAKDGANWLAARSKVKGKAIVLDVDDTTLATWNYELYSNWDFNPTTNGNFVTGELFPAVPGMVDMVQQANAEGYAIFFLTGRPAAQEGATLGNLTDSDTVGLDAGYPAPTTLSNGEDGLFTKPAVADYPAYLKAACADELAQNKSCTTIHYKSATRAHIESLGYEIVGNFGDQFSDLEGGFADKTFKMPNPNYFLP